MTKLRPALGSSPRPLTMRKILIFLVIVGVFYFADLAFASVSIVGTSNPNDNWPINGQGGAGFQQYLGTGYSGNIDSVSLLVS